MEKDIEKIGTSKVIPNEVLETIPDEERGRLFSIMKETMISSFMSNTDPIAEKITAEHISKVLDNANIQDERDRKERKSEKNYQIVYLLIGLAFIGFLIVYLKDDTELLYKIIIAIISFVGGFGVGKIRKKNGND